MGIYLSLRFYSIIVFPYDLDDFEKATKKLKLAEVTSDLGSEIEDPIKRKSKRPKRFLLSSSDEENDESQYDRPPKILIRNKVLDNNVVRSPKPNGMHVYSVLNACFILYIMRS